MDDSIPVPISVVRDNATGRCELRLDLPDDIDAADQRAVISWALTALRQAKRELYDHAELEAWHDEDPPE